MSTSDIGLHKKELDTPCLIIDKNKLERNLQRMRDHAIKHHVDVRPHCKTHKCSQLARYQMTYGAIGLSVAKVSEAHALISQGLTEILITSPVVTSRKIQTLLSCIKKAPNLIVVLDNLDNAETLHHAAEEMQQKINVLVDLDPGIGRTGVRFEHALTFGTKIHAMPWLHLMGLQCYAGNLQHISSFEERKKRSLDIMQQASEMRRMFQEHHLPCPILTGTGTGTYDIDIHATGVTEIQPGSYTVMDVEYADIESREHTNHAFEHALTMLTTVISSNRQEHVTVDAGTKSLYVDAMHKPQIISHPHLQYDWGGFGDEHGKITARSDEALPSNQDVLELIVPHCDPTINLFDYFYVIENDHVIDKWAIDLRGKSQ
jgi:D-serine deaminase-like pyridoxal phosphate-dependent protein